MTKHCSKCNKDKPTNRFCKAKTTRDRLTSWCIDCMGENNKERIEKRKTLTTADEIRQRTQHQTCRKCSEKKPSSEFRIAWGNQNGLRKVCRGCEAIAHRKRVASGVGCHTKEHKSKMYRKYALKNFWGLDQSEYDEMLSDQGGTCGICGSDTPGGGKKNFHIDHDHDSGEIRGLLCKRCNLGIGHFNDDPELILKAVAYLKKPPARRLKFKLVKTHA